MGCHFYQPRRTTPGSSHNASTAPPCNPQRHFLSPTSWPLDIPLTLQGGTLERASPTTIARGLSIPNSCHLHVLPQRERFSCRAGPLELPWRYRAELPSERPLQAPLSRGHLPRLQPRPQIEASTLRWFGGTTCHAVGRQTPGAIHARASAKRPLDYGGGAPPYRSR